MKIVVDLNVFGAHGTCQGVFEGYCRLLFKRKGFWCRAFNDEPQPLDVGSDGLPIRQQMCIDAEKEALK